MAAALLCSTIPFVDSANTKFRQAPRFSRSARTTRPAASISCHRSQPIEPILASAGSSDKYSTQEPSQFGDAYLIQVAGKSSQPIYTDLRGELQAIASVQGPYEVLTETEGQGSVPGGNNISVEFFDPQRQHKTPPKKEKVKVLLIGKGNMRMKIVEVAVKNGYAIYALVGDTTPSDPFELGVTIIPGDLDNHESLVEAVKAVDVVISVVGYAELTDQIKIIDAIKEAGNIKRFIISAEFINGAGPGHAVDPAELMYENLVQLKQNVEEAGIPYTFISYNFPADPFLPYLGGISIAAHAADRVTISGDGNLKAEKKT